MDGPLDFTESLPAVTDGLPTRAALSVPAAYALIHPASSTAYVGSTENLYNRIRQHKNHLARGTHVNQKLQAAYDRDNRFDLRFRVTDTPEAALDIEQSLLDAHFQDGALLNISSDARKAGSGHVVKDETRARLSEKVSAHFENPEVRAAHSDRLREKWQDPEYREKQCNRRVSTEQREQIGSTLRDKWKDPEYRESMISARSHRRVPVMVDGVRFDSLKDAAATLNLPMSTLYTRYKNTSNTSVIPAPETTPEEL